jgi:MFS family permease
MRRVVGRRILQTVKRRGTSVSVRGLANHAGLRRLGIIGVAFGVAEMGSWIAITTVAHDFGGVREAAFVVVLELAPAAVFAASAGSLAQRFGDRTVLRVGLGAQVVLYGALALVLAVDEPPRAMVYGLAVVASIAVTTTRPTLATITPAVADDPRQLAAATAGLGWIEGFAMLLGPAVTAMCLAFVGSWLAFVLFSVLVLLALTASVGLHVQAQVVREDGERVALAAASRAVQHDAGIRSVLLASAASSFALGALDILYVVLAVDVLGGRDADASWLNTAFGLGALVGGALALALSSGAGLWRRVVFAGGALAVLLTLLGVGSDTTSTAVVLAACGVAQAVLIVSVRTLLQRVTDLRLLCHVFALQEAAHLAMLLFGALLVPLFVDTFGARWAGVGVGCIVVAAIAPGARAMARADHVADAWLVHIPALRATELFALLPAPALETIARQAVPCTFTAGSAIIREGDVGDRFYAIVSGNVAVHVRGTRVATRSTADGVGELALLHDQPRTATVTALDDVDVLAIDRSTFLVAVTGHAPTMQRANGEIAPRYVR